jgi:hypothetical protein
VEDKSDPEKSKIFFLRRVHSSATDVRKTFARVRLEQQTQILVKEQAEIPQNQQAGAGSSGAALPRLVCTRLAFIPLATGRMRIFDPVCAALAP